MSPMRQRPFRPGFDHTVEAAPAVVATHVSALMRGDDPDFSGRSLDEHMMLTVPRAERHFWSPWLHLQIEPHRSEPAEAPDSARRSYVRGFFTPHPNLWTGFALTYMALGVLVFFGALWAFVQLQMHTPLRALWVVGLSAGSAALLYAISRLGQGLAAEQMDRLHTAVEQALGRSGAVSEGAGPERPAETPPGSIAGPLETH